MTDAGSSAGSHDAGEVTRLLSRLEQSPESLDRILSVVYQDIHRIAHFERAARGGYGPRTTVLVHEAFLKIFGREIPQLHDRVHLKRVAAMAVRQLIVDQARASMSRKRGGEYRHTPVRESDAAVSPSDAERVLSVEKALNRLEKHDRGLAELIVGSYYGGYTASELAELTGQSRRTIQRQLKRARGWLRLELEQEGF